MKSLDSTEVLIQGASGWMTTGPLPSPTAVLKAATLGRDRLIVCGKSYLRLRVSILLHYKQY